MTTWSLGPTATDSERGRVWEHLGDENLALMMGSRDDHKDESRADHAAYCYHKAAQYRGEHR